MSESEQVGELTQKCRKCGKSKPASDFIRRRSQGYASPPTTASCVSCREFALAYYHKHYAPDPARKQKAREAAKRYYTDNTNHCIGVARDYVSRNDAATKDNKRKWMLKSRYGLSVEQYDSLLKSQGGGCAICGAEGPGKKKTVFLVDHCHNTGKVRGLLCHSCNAALGLFKDNSNSLSRAIEYLNNANLGGENAKS